MRQLVGLLEQIQSNQVKLFHYVLLTVGLAGLQQTFVLLYQI